MSQNLLTIRHLPTTIQCCCRRGTTGLRCPWHTVWYHPRHWRRRLRSCSVLQRLLDCCGSRRLLQLLLLLCLQLLLLSLQLLLLLSNHRVNVCHVD